MIKYLQKPGLFIWERQLLWLYISVEKSTFIYVYLCPPPYNCEGIYWHVTVYSGLLWNHTISRLPDDWYIWAEPKCNILFLCFFIQVWTLSDILFYCWWLMLYWSHFTLCFILLVIITEFDTSLTNDIHVLVFFSSIICVVEHYSSLLSDIY